MLMRGSEASDLIELKDCWAPDEAAVRGDDAHALPRAAEERQPFPGLDNVQSDAGIRLEGGPWPDCHRAARVRAAHHLRRRPGRRFAAVAATSAQRWSTAFAVEQHGINHIGECERRGWPFDLFWIWCVANLISSHVIDGAIIVGFGLSFWAAVTVAVIGSGFSVPIGLCAIPGARARTATLAIFRSAFGIRGNAPVAFLSWLTAVGGEAVNIVIGTISRYQIAQECGAGSRTTWKVATLLVVVVLTFGVAILGIAAITVLNKSFSYVLGIGTVILGILVLPKINFHVHPQLGAPIHVGAWLLALLVMTAAPLSWVNTAADDSRYLPGRTSGRRITLWTALGNLVPAVLITMVGVATATATGMTDPVAGLKNIRPSWFFVGYLAMVVGGTITNNSLNTYSSGMSLRALGLKVKRWQAVIIDASVATALSITPCSA